MRVRRHRLKLILFSALLIMGACVDPYPPPSSIGNTSFLVVEGYLNASTNSVHVRVNHSVALADSKTSPPEEGATVSVEAQGGESFSLNEVEKGVYSADNLT